MNNERNAISKEPALEGIVHMNFSENNSSEPFLEVNIKVENDEFDEEEQNEVEIDRYEPFAEVNVKNEYIADQEEEDNVMETETSEEPFEPFEEINVKNECVSDEEDEEEEEEKETEVVEVQVQREMTQDPLADSRTVKPRQRTRNTDKESEKVLFECDICKKTFGLLFLLVAHKRIHAPERTPDGGDICRENPLDGHSSVHAERIHTCDMCSKMFTELSALKEHQLTHTGEKPFVCGMCSCWFTKLVSLHVHMRTHNSVKSDKRSPGSSSSSSSSSSSVNQRKEMNLECSVCKKKFEQRGQLLVHCRLHYRERSYECEYCHKLFGQKYLLNNHILTHSERKLFECDVCLRKFSNSSTLTRHFEKFHVNDRIFGEKH